MNNIEERVAALIESPLGCAFLLTVEASGLTPREVAEPAMSLHMCAYASKLTEVWRADRDRIRPEVLRLGSQKAGLARLLLEEPTTYWWFAPLDINQQIYIPRSGSPPDQSQLTEPNAQPTRSERYSQRHEGGLFTSTWIKETSSLCVALDDEVADIGMDWNGPPYRTWMLKASSSARILEVNGALDWHNLCVRYPADGGSDIHSPDFSGDEGRVVPDWSAVAADWDAAHLTFGGLLTMDLVRIESEKGWTYHWGWDMEQTMWLRWMFTDIERLADHEPIESPLEGLINPHLEFRLRKGLI